MAENYKVMIAATDSVFKEGDLITIEGLNDGQPWIVINENSRTLITIRPFTLWDRFWNLFWRRPNHAWKWSDWMPEQYYTEKEMREYYQRAIDEFLN